VGWQDLLSKSDETVTLPWLGGRAVRSATQTWTLGGPLPQEYGWYTFKVVGRHATRPTLAEPQPDKLVHIVKGYLVGDRVVPDGARVDPDPKKIIEFSERVYLLEPGLDRFARVAAGRAHEVEPLVYRHQEMPLGSETDVLQAFLDQKPSVDDIKGISPALDAAFRMEVWQREEAERRRHELERLRREEEERRQREERHRQLVEKLGDGAGRRAMAAVDFEEAARAALAVGGATLLDVRRSVRHHEMIVRYRLDGRRYECVCDARTLRIIEAGICLTSHEDGERGDERFTLESISSVVREADRLGVLVVLRHV
jgi:hypothetical protein